MNKFTTYVLALQLLSITMVTISMDAPYPQLQLQKAAPQLSLDAELRLENLTPTYLANSIHEEKLFRFNVPSNTPILTVSLEIKNHIIFEVPENIPTLIPATLFYNCDEGSCVHFTRPIAGKIYCIKAICRGNKELSTENFKEQYNTSMKCFYEKGPFFKDDHPNVELSLDEIINTTIAPQNVTLNSLITITIAPNMLITALFSHCIGVFFSHGTNGCSTEERFTKLMIQKNIKQYSNNPFTYLMQRQIGKPSPQLQHLTEKEKKKQRKIPTISTVTALCNLPDSSNPLYKLSKKVELNEEPRHAHKNCCVDLPNKNIVVQEIELSQRIK